MVGFLAALAPFAPLIGGVVQGLATRGAANQQVAANNQAREDQREGVERADEILSGSVGQASGILQRNLGVSRNALNRGYGDARDAVLDAYQTQEGIFDPMMQGGNAARGAYDYNLGVGDRPDGYRGFRGSPGYQFQLGQGLRAIDGSAASRGNLFSGATMRAAQQYGTGLADQSFNTYMGQLDNRAQTGERAGYALAGAAGQLGNALGQMDINRGAQLSGMQTQYGNNRANLITGTSANRAQVHNSLGQNLSQLSLNAGDARAAGSVGFGNAINDGISNALGYHFYDKYAPRPGA